LSDIGGTEEFVLYASDELFVSLVTDASGDTFLTINEAGAEAGWLLSEEDAHRLAARLTAWAQRKAQEAAHE